MKKDNRHSDDFSQCRLSDSSKQLILLYSGSLTGRKAKTINGFSDWEKVFLLAKKHKIASCCFRALSVDAVPEGLYSEWKNYSDYCLKREILFSAERNSLFNEFEIRNIKYVPLKGELISSLYPQSGMREFADNDILIFPDDFNKSIEVLKSRDYRLRIWIHDVAGYKEPIYNFELHNSLFDSGLEEGKAFENIFSRLEKNSDNEFRYSMTKEDFYLYFISHFLHHYETVGAGLKFLGDIFVIKQSDEYFSGIEIEKALRKSGLFEFEKRMSFLADRIFLDGEIPECDELRYILNSGSNGNRNNLVLNKIKNNKKSSYLLSRIFLPHKHLEILYPSLKKHPRLLIFFEIKRWIKTILNPKKFRKTIDEIRILIQSHK